MHQGLEDKLADLESNEAALEDKYLYDGFPKDRYEVNRAKLMGEKTRCEVERFEAEQVV